MTPHALHDETAAGPPLFEHGAAVHDTDGEFVRRVLPFLEEGLRTGDRVIVAVSDDQLRLLSSIVSDPAVSVLRANEHYAHPVRALRANRALFEGHLRAGASRIRILGSPPHDSPLTWRAWARYEALSNRQMADLPVSALCTYDRQGTSDDALADVRSLHPQLTGADGDRASNPHYLEAEDFMITWSQAAIDTRELGDPQLSLENPTPAEGRRAVARAASGAGVDPDGLVIAVSEALANAYLHGRSPVRLRAWVARSRVEVTVTDAGRGPSDPFAGLVPPAVEATSGRGLWISHQVCDFFAIGAGADGCVARMVGVSPAA